MNSINMLMTETIVGKHILVQVPMNRTLANSVASRV